MHDAHIIGELLLAIHVSFGTSQHDTSLHRTEGVRTVPDLGIPQPLRIHGANDNVQEPRSARGQKIRGHVELGQE